MTTFRPLLAATLDDEKARCLNYPVLASPKIDGVRCIITPEGPRSRSLKPIRNKYVMTSLTAKHLIGFDGELVIGDPTDPLCFNKTASAISTIFGEPEFTFYIFDNYLKCAGFESRLETCKDVAKGRVKFLEHRLIKNRVDLYAYEEAMVSAGFEGIMLRSPTGWYKYGRSTLREGLLLKLKRFNDAEGLIVGMAEKLHNENESIIDPRGYKTKAKCQENMTPAGVMGALTVRSPLFKEEFEVGTGFTEEQRKWFWDNKETLINKPITFKYQQHGTIERPRIPVFKCLYEPGVPTISSNLSINEIDKLS